MDDYLKIKANVRNQVDDNEKSYRLKRDIAIFYNPVIKIIMQSRKVQLQSFKHHTKV